MELGHTPGVVLGLEEHSLSLLFSPQKALPQHLLKDRLGLQLLFKYICRLLNEYKHLHYMFFLFFFLAMSAVVSGFSMPSCGQSFSSQLKGL